MSANDIQAKLLLQRCNELIANHNNGLSDGDDETTDVKESTSKSDESCEETLSASGIGNIVEMFSPKATKEPESSESDQPNRKKPRKEQNDTSSNEEPNKSTKLTNITCPYCPFKYNSRAVLNKHVVKKHPNEPCVVNQPSLRCQFCSFITLSRANLANHIRVNHGKKTSQCPHCDYKSFWSYKVKKHIAKNHSSTNKIDNSPNVVLVNEAQNEDEEIVLS